MNKERAIAVVNNLPEKFEPDTLFEQLVFVEKVEQGVEQLNGDIFTHSQVKEKVKEWQKI